MPPCDPNLSQPLGNHCSVHLTRSVRRRAALFKRASRKLARLVTGSRLVFTDRVRWRLRLPLQPESRRTRKLFRARSPVGRRDGDRPLKEPNCARMAAHSEVIGVGAGVGATKEGKMAPNSRKRYQIGHLDFRSFQLPSIREFITRDVPEAEPNGYLRSRRS